MTQKENQLLLKDLCARLPYGLKVKCEKYSFPVTVLYAGNINEVKFVETGGIEHICLIKPYLRPMSSMTEEEFKEYHSMLIDVDNSGLMNQGLITKIVDWLDKKMFDHRNLIPKGLALKAKEGMYKTE